ncbi:MAG TPA: outer membrane protein assembly factor BamD [Candidatus Krumholzibacteria bacterium]
MVKFLTLLLTLLVVVGCGGRARHMATGSFERGEAQFLDEAYVDAIDDLKLFIRRNPTDDRADDAQFYIARSHQERKDYPVAAVEFEILRKDYPNSEWFDEAYFQQGMCYLEEVPRIEIEQTVTRDAVDHFRRYLRDLPDGAFVAPATAHVAELQLRLDEKMMRAIDHYMKLQKYRAAAIYIGVFLTDRSDSVLVPRALFLQARAERKLDHAEAADNSLRQLIERFPEHELASKAAKELGESASRSRGSEGTS